MRSKFPSPQGGSETMVAWDKYLAVAMFPSPQGGSETKSVGVNLSAPPGFHPLKAGRRLPGPEWHIWDKPRFHPLKAGRRRATIATTIATATTVSIPSRRVGDCLGLSGIYGISHVSIPSRRVGDWCYTRRVCSRVRCFHPLKAGRRQHFKKITHRFSPKFPSPQGGSETVDASGG